MQDEPKGLPVEENENTVDQPKCIPHSIPYETFSHTHWSDFIDSSLSYVHLENKATGEGICVSTEPTPEVEVNANNSLLK